MENQNIENQNTASQAMQAPPSNHLAMAIITTLICCLPAGIVSIVYASQVNSKFQAGDYEAALRASKNAKTWWLVALIVGLVGIIGYAIFIFTFGADAILEEYQRQQQAI